MLKEVMTAKTMCDEPHTEDREGERFFVTDAAGNKYVIDLCDRHKGRFLRHAQVVVPTENGQANGQVEAVEPSEPGLTTTEVAERLRLTPSYVSKLGIDGRLKVLTPGGSNRETLYSVASVEAEEARRAERPHDRRMGRNSQNAKATIRRKGLPRGGSAQAPSDEHWMNAQEAAERLKVTVSRVSDLARSGHIKYRKLGPRRAQYDRKSVEARVRAVGA